MSRLLTAVALAAIIAPCALAQHYSFIVTGDCRSAGLPGRKGFDENGVNKTILKEQVNEIIRRKVRFVMVTGDLVLGYTTEEGFRSQLEGWMSLFRPVYNAGIHVYSVRGNHDAYSKNAMKVWNEIFKGRYANPLNGPTGEENCTFAAHEENALILGLDDWAPHEHSVNEGWLDRQLAANRAPHVFAMGHEMAFKDGHHDDNLDNNEYARDAFVLSLNKGGAKVYFAGHDHFYDHMLISDPKDHPGVELDQLVVGTAGAPFYHGSDYNGHNGDWKLTPVKHIEDTYGYELVEINGLKVTMHFMARKSPGHYEPVDTFEYTAPVKP